MPDTSRTGTNRLGAGLVTIAAMPSADPRGAVMKVPEVGEEKRFCWSCGQAVGRAKGGREGRTSGFCPNCGAGFDFDPKLGPGLIVGGQYEVIGCLAHGGFGWIYLAVDKNVSDRAVVLKGVLNQGDTEAVAAAIAEQRFLAELEHGNIVEIYNFVEHAGNGYIVMEFVGGKSLKTILKDRMVANGGRANPMPVDQSIAYMLGILPALGYLHRQGYLYCDFKPDNVMHQGEDLKLIDLGGVRKIDDDHSSIYGTVGFQAPEIATLGTSISSDVYTVVRTLAVMTLDLPGYQNQFKHSLPDVAAEPLFQKYESFYRLLIKGTAENPDDRFQSVDELSDQLNGVLREVVAVDTRQARPSVSNRFTGDRWQPKTGSGLSINDLPDLKPNLEDPAASFLAEIVTDDPVSALTKITAELDSGRVPDTIEVKLRAVRAYGESDDVANAQRLLAAIRTEDPWEWRASWYEGLVAMSRGTFAAAVLEFDRVRTDVPGELAPKLAAAMAAEGAQDFPEAASLYELVLQVDSAYVTAAFGLARCRVALGDVDGAVAVLDKVPTSSAARGAAMEEIGRVLLGRAVATGAVADAAGAAKAVEASTSDARRRRGTVRRDPRPHAAGFSQGRLQPQPQLQMFGQPATEPGRADRVGSHAARTGPHHVGPQRTHPPGRPGQQGPPEERCGDHAQPRPPTPPEHQHLWSPPRRRLPKPRRHPSRSSATCPSCDEPVDVSARFCEACGTPLVSATATVSSAPPEGACGACGASDGFDPDGFCLACGRRTVRPRDHMETDLVWVASVTDKGPRKVRNEDAYALAVLPGGGVALAVCDGVSNIPRSDEASQGRVGRRGGGAQPTGRRSGHRRRAHQGRSDASAFVAGLGNSTVGGEPPSCTFLAVSWRPGRAVSSAWIGDCRAYWLGAGGVRRLTTDHSWGADQVAAGRLTQLEADKDERSHAITRWLGADAQGEPVPDIIHLDLAPGDRGVLAAVSDGAWNYLANDAELATLVGDAGLAGQLPARRGPAGGRPRHRRRWP